MNAARDLGESWTVSEEVLSGLERLTCRLYGMPRADSVNECRYIKLTSTCCSDNLNIIRPTKKLDTAFIPPAFVAFVEHVERANYQVGIWKRSHIKFPTIPEPTDDQGWCENGVPKWYEGDMLPQRIINELPTVTDDQGNDDATVEDEEENEDDNMDIDDEFEVDYSEFIGELFNDSNDEEEFEGFDEDEY